MNQVVVFYNPFLPELKISVNGKKLSPYSSLMSFQHQRLEKWSDCLFTELYREVNSDYEMLCVSNEFTCEWLEELAHRSSHCISFMSQALPMDANVYERLGKLEMLGGEETDESIIIPVVNVKGIAEDLEDILYRQNIESYRVPGHEVDTRRQKIKAYCPECDTALSGDTASRQYAFPVIGGPSVGKTCFINMAIDQMMSDVAPARSWKMSFISDTEEKDHALAMKSLNQGVRLMKTELNSLTAYQLMLKLPNEKIGRRIYVYDISGEMFSSSSDVQNNLAYSYANGFIFIIDPLTLNQFAMDVEDKVDLNAYGASSKDFDDILNIMLINLEKMFGLKDKDTLKRNLAVVINKVDIPTLEEKIGETAAQQYLAENAKTCKSYMDARDAVCRNFLEEYGAGNFVRTAEAKFKTVRYFTCSALGHNHEGQPYEGKNVVDPVMWLLQQADSSIKAE